MIHKRAEVHILADEQASREYINQMWAKLWRFTEAAISV